MPDEQDLLVDESDYAEAWIPENKDDSVSGVVTEVTSAYSDQSESMYPLVIVKEKDGTEKAIHCFRLVLANKMRELKPRIGENLTVIFKGIKPNKSNPNRKTYLYTVNVDGRSPDIWGDSPTQNQPSSQSNDQGGSTNAPFEEEEEAPF